MRAYALLQRPQRQWLPFYYVPKKWDPRSSLSLRVGVFLGVGGNTRYCWSTFRGWQKPASLRGGWGLLSVAFTSLFLLTFFFFFFIFTLRILCKLPFSNAVCALPVGKLTAMWWAAGIYSAVAFISLTPGRKSYCFGLEKVISSWHRGPEWRRRTPLLNTIKTVS